MRPQDDKRPLTLAEFAAAIAVPLAKARLWVLAWEALGVAGVQRVSRPQGGVRFAIAADMPRQWRRCQLPIPRMPDAAKEPVT